ncbi:hypothetical protein ACFVXH_17160 [Kitasatospora sp. NPDC058184]
MLAEAWTLGLPGAVALGALVGPADQARLAAALTRASLAHVGAG